MSRLHSFLAALAVLLFCTGTVWAQDLTALARLTGEGATLSDRRGGFDLTLEMTRPVPWRVFTLDNPPRLVLDFAELDWEGLEPLAFLSASENAKAMNVGLFRPGWSRMVLEMAGPMLVEQAAMSEQGQGARVDLRLVTTDADVFSAHAGALDTAHFGIPHDPTPLPPPRQRQRGDGPLVVVLDPGHGGIDPGAERENVVEADLMLRFALELKEMLLRNGGFKVVLTREEDIFIPLEERVTAARRAEADVFLSLHADVLAQGRASGATVYTLSEEASDIASEKLAERHDRADLLAGVDLSHQDDEVALILMELARRETAPRSERLADALVEGIHSETGSTYKSPRLYAGFSVLKAPDIPSVLIELGFLSSERDRTNLMSEDWRRRAANGILNALLYWAIEDAAEADRLRQ